MHDLTAFPALVGGVLIGASAVLFLWSHGAVAGISGLWTTVLTARGGARTTAAWFVLGLALAGLAARIVQPAAFGSSWTPGLGLALVAGLVVGLGTRLGNGCTSGHGVCGVGRLAPRSIAATCTFVLMGMVTVFVVRHVLVGRG